MIIDGHQTISVPRCYTPLTLLAIAGMTDTRRAVHVKPMQPDCDGTADGSHPLSRGSSSLSMYATDGSTPVSVVTIVCVACGRYGNTEAANIPGGDTITS